MSGTLNVFGDQSAYDATPDRIPPVTRGTYLLQVSKAEVLDNKNKNGQNLVISAFIADDNSPFKGRSFTQYYGLPNSTDDQTAVDNKRVRIKQFLTAVGITGPAAMGAIDLAGMKDKRFSADCGPDVYTDPTTGQSRENSKILNVLKPDGSSF